MENPISKNVLKSEYNLHFSLEVEILKNLAIY